MNKLTIYFSKRNLPLLLIRVPEENEPIMTVENWENWDQQDGLYVVYHDGMVQSVLDDKFLNRQFHEVAARYQKNNDPIFFKGAWNPAFTTDLAEEFCFEMDTTSDDMIIGRWERINNYE